MMLSVTMMVSVTPMTSLTPETDGRYLHTPVKVKRVDVVHLDSVVEVTKVAAVHRNLDMIVLNVNCYIEWDAMLEGVPAVPFLGTPRPMLAAVPYDATLVEANVEMQGSVHSRIKARSTL